MRGRPAFGGGTFLLALLLPWGWRPAIAAPDPASGCQAADEIGLLRCQLDEARTLLEEKDIEHMRVVKEKDIELAQKDAAVKDMEAKLARKEAQDKAPATKGVLSKASKRSTRPSAQMVWKEQQKHPDRWRRSHLSKHVLEKDTHGRLLGETKDLATVIASLRNDTKVINLKYKGLTGTVPAELGNFAQLNHLDLTGNKLTGTVPAELGKLAQLKYLAFENNQLTGTVPAELGNLAQLTVLNLKDNQLTGTVPAELGNLAQLTVLNLENNQLTGTVPAAEWGKLAQLKTLDLSDNQLTGTVPAELLKLAQLTRLDLSDNQLTGTLPPELGNLEQLISLYLHQNQLTGTVPAELGKLAQLKYFGASDNQLTGTIPPQLGKLTQLVSLTLGNNRLAGTIPPELGNLTLLSTLSLHKNKLTGTIPPELGNMTKLKDLNLYKNLLTGTLPAELGNLVEVSTIDLSTNLLTGAVPTEFAKLASLDTLDLGGNRLTGMLPDEIGSLTNLKWLRLRGNAFSGTLTSAIGQLEALQELNITDNPGITGRFPDMRNADLRTVYASNCSFTSAGAMGDSVEAISFASNKFTEFPAEWVNLPGVLDLDVSNNLISEWRPYGVIASEDVILALACLAEPVLPGLKWPIIQSLKLSGNPFGQSITLRDFLWSFAYVTSLAELSAADCSLQGEVPDDVGFLALDIDLDNCESANSIAQGLNGLLTLDLSGNNITAILPPPPLRLSSVDLHGNPIVQLGPEWYNRPNTLQVWNDSLLRLNVAPPFRERGCPNEGTSTFEADPFGFVAMPGDAFQCTTLCAGVKTRYKFDASVNFSSLCRCTVGTEGAAASCTGCPADTYSHAEDRWEMVRTCRRCPEYSSTELVENASSVNQCKCRAGWYMETPAPGAANATAAPACKRCKQGRFMDTLPGATQESQCMCNASFDGLRALLGVCGCADGLYMDNLARACRRCDTVAEECTWGSHIDLSLLPPVIKPAYWAAPPPEVGPDEVSTFSKHEIWRCFSKDTCLGNSTCAAGRSGTACSLCVEGMYGGPDGPCKPCPYNPKDSQKTLLYGLLIGPSATIAAHMLLQLSPASRGTALTLASLRTSLKQFLKYLQMLGVMAGFNINWPPMPNTFMTSVSRVSIALPQAAGVACLTGQQTASLEMGFRWLMPVAGLLSACVSALLLAPIHLFGRRRTSRFNKFLHMSHWDVLRVSLWGLALFYSSLLQFGTQVLACAPGPNGIRTVVTFPHLQCGGGGEWAQLAGISFAFLLVFVGAVFLGIYAAWRRETSALVETGFKSSGWWGFMFTDYRDGWGHWLMLTMAKDAALVVIATASASDGSGQLLATAAVATVYSYLVLRDQPFKDPSNSILEAWTMMSVASLSVVMAGMGFQSSVGVADVTDLYRDGASDPVYMRRELTLLAVQIATLVGPAVIMMYQLLCVSETVRNCLPAFLRPPTQEERAKWKEEFFRSLKMDEAATPELWGVMDRFDVVDNAKFRDLMSTSTATLGVIPGSERGLTMKSVVRKRFTTELRKASSRSSDNLRTSGELPQQLQEEQKVQEFPGVATMAPIETNKATALDAAVDEASPGDQPASLMWANKSVGAVVCL